MNAQKMHIIANKNGINQGYIKAISYKTGSFKITKDRLNAKGYTTHDEVHDDIDFLTKYNYNKGYIFLYE